MKKSKKIIDTYETIYSVDLVVANENVKLKDLQKYYTYYNDSELDDSILDAVCTVCRAKRKSDNKYICLVKYNHPSSYLHTKDELKIDMINTCAHESCHVALDIYEFIEEQPCTQHQEVFAYFVGWIAECIYKTLNKK